MVPRGESVNPRSQCRTQRRYWRDLGLGLSQTWSISCRGRDGKRERERWVSLCGVAISPQSLVWECKGVTRSPALSPINILQLTCTLLSLSLCLSLTACIEGSERLEMKLDKPQQVSKSYPFLINRMHCDPARHHDNLFLGYSVHLGGSRNATQIWKHLAIWGTV